MDSHKALIGERAYNSLIEALPSNHPIKLQLYIDRMMANWWRDHCAKR